MVKNSIKKLKKVIKADIETGNALKMAISTGGGDQGKATSLSPISPISPNAKAVFKVKELKKRLKEESEYINKTLALLHIPLHSKKAEEDDLEEDQDEVDDVPVDVKKAMKARLQMQMKQRAKNPSDLHARLQLKLAELRGVVKNGKNQKKAKLTKAEKKAKAKEQKRLQAKLKKATLSSSVAGAKPAKPVYDGGKMVFSKFDFGSGKSPDSVKTGAHHTTDPRAALVKVQKQKEKIKVMKSRGQSDQVQEMEDRLAWKSALDKAEGIKVKDDEGLLKKTIKKMEQKKNKSKKKWDERLEAEESRKKGKQQKRSENISKRKADKKAKKVKKGRVSSVPGFR